jgi:O-antigen ligase
MNKLLYFRVINRLLVIISTLSIIGYPLVVCISLILNINNHNVSVIMRVLIFLISIFVFFISTLFFFYNLTKNKSVLLNRVFLYLLLIYGIRLASETFFHSNELGNSPLFYWKWYIVVILMPLATIIFFSDKKYDFNLNFFFIKYFLVFINFVVFFYNYSINGRAQLIHLNSISFGHIGGSLTLILVWQLGVLKKINYKTFLVCIMLILLGFYTLIISASKGAFLSFIFAFILLSFFNKNIIKIFRFNYLIIIFLSLIILLIYNYSNIIETSSLIARLSNFANDPSTIIRSDMYRQSMELIINNPMFGSQIEIRSYKFYPHNLFLEYSMATGLFCGVFLLLLVLFVLLKGLNLLKSHNQNGWIFVLFLQFFFDSLISGCVYLSIEFWMTLILSVIAISKNHKIFERRFKFLTNLKLKMSMFFLRNI